MRKGQRRGKDRKKDIARLGEARPPPFVHEVPSGRANKHAFLVITYPSDMQASKVPDDPDPASSGAGASDPTQI